MKTVNARDAVNNGAYIAGLKRAAEYIMERIKETGDGYLMEPVKAIILGSGLGALADMIAGGGSLEYLRIPGFESTTVKGHDGRLVWGRIGSKSVIAMKGRLHYYEGHEMEQVVAGIRILSMMGVSGIIITNAAGGIRKDLKVGDLMLITDHIGLFSQSPLRGPNIDALGPRFPDMTEAYSVQLRDVAIKIADTEGISLKKGVYAYAKGPMYETPAEIRALAVMGADAVGMSTVPEVVAARHAGMKVLGISCITNTAAGIEKEGLSHEDVVRNAGKAEADFIRLVVGVVGEWPDQN